MDRIVTFKGNPLTLVGRNISVGKPAADFSLTAADLSEVKLGNFSGKIKVLTSFPSIDTPVCDLQVKTFNKQATTLGNDVVVVGISKDLPFAQKRFCETFDIKNVTLASDYKTGSFGINYGLLIRELNLLARSIIIVDKQDTLRYIDVVKEVTSQPDYEAAFKALEEILKNPDASGQRQVVLRCKACEGGEPALPKEKIDKLMAQSRGWELVEDRKLVKELKFKDFLEAKYFLDLISVIAEEQKHHPTLTLIYNKLKITLTTHAASGLTDNDFIMSRIIDELNSY